MNELILLYCHETSGWLVFVRFLEEIEDIKRHCKINWPLEIAHRATYMWWLSAPFMSQLLGFYCWINQSRTDKIMMNRIERWTKLGYDQHYLMLFFVLISQQNKISITYLVVFLKKVGNCMHYVLNFFVLIKI